VRNLAPLAAAFLLMAGCFGEQRGGLGNDELIPCGAEVQPPSEAPSSRWALSMTWPEFNDAAPKFAAFIETDPGVRSGNLTIYEHECSTAHGRELIDLIHLFEGSPGSQPSMSERGTEYYAYLVDTSNGPRQISVKSGFGAS
jgi:hypothetical protein